MARWTQQFDDVVIRFEPEFILLHDLSLSLSVASFTLQCELMLNIFLIHQRLLYYNEKLVMIYYFL